MTLSIDLQGNVALVTGANSPIGLAIASNLEEAGAQVVLATHNNTDNLESFYGSIPEKVLSADLRSPESIENLISETLAITNQLDLIVNNAALQNVVNLFEIDSQEWDAVLETNLRSIHLIMKEARQALSESRNPSIVNIASIEAHQPPKGHSHYSDSKAALLMLTKSAALEYSNFGIRVNSVSPGLIDDGHLKDRWPEGVDRWLRSAPLEKMGDPNDVANAVVFLASPMASWITGADLIVDGGISVNSTW